VVEPEINHHLVELAFAVNRAKDFLLREIGQYPALALHPISQFRCAHLARHARLRAG
jgi:hypothetical protein